MILKGPRRVEGFEFLKDLLRCEFRDVLGELLFRVKGFESMLQGLGCRV